MNIIYTVNVNDQHIYLNKLNIFGGRLTYIEKKLKNVFQMKFL